MNVLCLVFAVLCLIFSLLIAAVRAKSTYKSGRILTPFRILFAGVISSSFISFLPLCKVFCEKNELGGFESVFLSILNTMKLFFVGLEFEFITENLPDVIFVRGYTVLFSILFVLAPVLTFGFVLSFFKNLSAYRRLFAHFYSGLFIFSELNEKSLALARSLSLGDGKKRFFVFSGVIEDRDEESSELVEKAKEIGAVCFKKGITALNFRFHSKKSEMNFFLIGEDQSENLSDALSLMQDFKTREYTKVFVFSSQMESEMVLAGYLNQSGSDTKIKVRIVNEVQSLILRTLYENGFESIFKSALEIGESEKKINAVVLGMGPYGIEMTKALSWFCQMDGFLSQIDSFSTLPKAHDRFCALCPELMDFSGKLDVDGETRYTITIHSDVDPDSISFYKKLESLPQTTFVFVALEDDEKTISAAMKLREFFERKGYRPKIQAVVQNSDKKEILIGATNFRGEKYEIDFIGDVKSSYTEGVILSSDLEEAARKRHKKWAGEASFWMYNYNYKSSTAAAIHKKMKLLCGIPGIEKEPEDRSVEERLAIRKLEHRRWNAYMRSEGYIYGGTLGSEGRSDLAKKHNCLVPFDQLPISEQQKDDN